MKYVIPLQINFQSPQLSKRTMNLSYGVVIGITGDVAERMVLAADSSVFNTISEIMFGMQLEKEMLSSFSGELGNMIAGGMAVQVMNQELKQTSLFQ